MGHAVRMASEDPDMSAQRAPRADAVEQASAGRAETELEKLDRNWNELLQELRVMQTGTQIVTAFLIILPFQSRFPELVHDREGWYVALLVASVLVTVTMLMPVAIHRRLFRRGVKAETVRWGDRIMKAALAGLALVLAGCVAFIATILVPGTGGWAIAGCTAVVIGALMLFPLRP